MKQQTEIEFLDDFENWRKIYDNKYPLHILTLGQLFDKYIAETYGSKGSDEIKTNKI